MSTAKNFMVKKVIFVDVEGKVFDVTRIMMKNNIGAVLVNEKKKL